jgi:outer membrane protein assembly factor BamB
MKGQRMRCPNPICREVFEVREEEAKPQPPTDIYGFESDAKKPVPPATPPKKPTKSSGSVSDVVPLLDSSSAGPPPTAPVDKSVTPPNGPQRVASWQDEPPAPRTASRRDEPPVKRSGEPTATPGSTESGVRIPPDKSPEGVPAKTPPPVQPPRVEKPVDAEEDEPLEEVIPASEFVPPDAEPSQRELDSLDTVTPPRGRKALLLSVGMLAGVVLVLGGAAAFFFVTMLGNEKRLYEVAEKDVAEGRWSSATADFKKLVETYDKSERIELYRFMLELSKIGEEANATLGQNPPKNHASLKEFVKGQAADNPIFKERRKLIGSIFIQIAQNLGEDAVEKNVPEEIDEAHTALKEALEYGASASEVKTNAEKLDSQKAQIILALKHKKLIDDIQAIIAAGPTPDLLKIVRDRVAREHHDNDSEIVQLLKQAETVMRAKIQYVEVNEPPARPTPDANEPGLLVTPWTAKSPKPKDGPKRVVLALDRGVLYALDQATGKDLWAVRVGIDTTALPVRLPKTAVSPERFLVLSADRNSLMALAAEDGSVAWRHTLKAPCLGRPAVDETAQRAFVPTYDGRVNEIELNGGVLLGYFDLHEHLSLGAVLQESTDCLFVPGDSENVYVLDIGRNQTPGKPPRKKACVDIIATGHPSGSLRSEPLVLQRVDPRRQPVLGTPAPGYLVLCQTDGFKHMKLRVFGLPAQPSDAPAIRDRQIDGWSWFEPRHDAEKLAFVTDAGYVGLYGINQPGNEDEAVFAYNRDPIRLGSDDSHLVRGQVVHAQDDDFWIVAGGRLQRYHFDVFGKGKQMLPSPEWPSEGIATGSPIHTGQMDETNSVLVTVTRDLARQLTLATAVDSNKGKLLWQRQLGIDSHGDPLPLGKSTLVVDRSGAILLHDGDSPNLHAGGGWEISDALLAGPIEGLVAGSIQLIPVGTDTAYQLAVTAQPDNQGYKLVVRTIRSAAEGKQPTIDEKSIELVSLPQGTGAVVNGSLVLPLADGSLHRFKLPLAPGSAGADRGGPDWRSRWADDDARGYVIALQGDDFLCTDGSRGIKFWSWQPDGSFRALPPTNEKPAEVPARILNPPLVQYGPEKKPSQIWVADAAGAVSLLNGSTLKVENAWQLSGRVTAGPFLRGQQVLAVVDRTKLVCLEPAKPAPAWQYEMKGNEIVGEPALVDGMLIVASPLGRFVGLDPRDGQPRGPGYALSASAAPTGAPVVSGSSRALVPLTDGTVFFLSPQLLLDQQAAAPKPSPGK